MKKFQNFILELIFILIAVAFCIVLILLAIGFFPKPGVVVFPVMGDLGVLKNQEAKILSTSNSVFIQPTPLRVFKITCFTLQECQTPICQSGQIKLGEVALNPKHGKDKIVIIDGETYYAKWISDYKTDVDIYMEDYQECVNFGVQYKKLILN